MIRDKRGAVALEFTIAALVLFLLLFIMFDIGRYAITMHSLRMLANAGARGVIIHCYTDAVTTKTTYTSPSACVGMTPLTLDEQQQVAPFLFAGGLTPTLNVLPSGATALKIQAAQPEFKMIIRILWGASLDNLSASTSLPF